MSHARPDTCLLATDRRRKVGHCGQNCTRDYECDGLPPSYPSLLSRAPRSSSTPGTAAAVSLPTVSAVTPNRGPDAGGTSVTVTGTNLTGATAVYFGSVQGTSIVVGSATSLTVTSPAQTSATVDITVVTPGGTSLTSAADVYTYEKVLFTDSFTNATTAEPMYLPAGTGATNVACLTAGSSTTQTPVPDCASSGGDTAGQGVLRLTSNAGNLEGSAFYSTSLPTANGLDLTFNTYQYGSSSEADGIAFSLGATDPSNPSAPVNMGPAGGHLGYSAGSAAPAGVGLAHGYMGFGLDVYGNYTNSQYDGSGCTDPSWLTASAHAQNVTVRGPGNGMVGYCVLDSTLNSAHGGGLGGKKLDNITGTDSTRSTSVVPVEVALNPQHGTGSYRVGHHNSSSELDDSGHADRWHGQADDGRAAGHREWPLPVELD